MGDLAGLREASVRLVEELELLVALALGDVRAVAEERDGQRDEKDRRCPRLLDENDRENEPRLVFVAVTTASIPNI